MKTILQTSNARKVDVDRVIYSARAYSRRDRAGNFKIGITCDPYGRASKYGEAYDEMLLLQRCPNVDTAKWVERRLIEVLGHRSDNLKAGGGGPNPDRKVWVYLVRTWP